MILLSFGTEAKSISEDVMPAGNVAHGLVWSHYAGYLQYVLPGKISDIILISQFNMVPNSSIPNLILKCL